MSKLYIVATPIGNLSDITLRAIDTLKSVDLIACEDTRVTKKLLNRFDIKKPTISFHQHSKVAKIDYLINQIKQGKPIALVTDAGTPGISDPCGILVAEAVKSHIDVEPIPGPSALTTLISASGIAMDRFTFLGFLPHKKGKQTLIKEMVKNKYPVVFYESTHRIMKTLEAIKLESDKVNIVVGRELTKKFETIYRGNIKEVIDQILKDSQKGEFVVIVFG
ncbi:16S rRNA (cytidine(1402)-2'-O)-methyltransferase [Patescibacteria group bacterium]|nr:16S rRNA (cytidine(1402)-2'-O)-methyltransferase [Patescibacteria group bacterium]